MSNLPIPEKQTQLILVKSKKLMRITNQILLNSRSYTWMKSLWLWADSNDIMDLEWIDDDSRKNNGY